MTFHESRRSVAIGEPDIGFQAGFGFYLGIVATGTVAIVGLIAGTGTATLLGVLPSTVTAVAIVGHIYAKRAHGLPERIGRSRRRRLACYVPPIGFATLLLVPMVVPIDGAGRFVVVTIVLLVLTGVTAFGLERMARNRYIDAVTGDEPTVTWTWHRPAGDVGYNGWVTTANAVVLVAAGLVSVSWYSIYGLGMLMLGVATLISNWTDWGDRWTDSESDDEDADFSSTDQWNPPDIHAYEVGLVLDRFHKTLVPWDEIEAVRLTDDELVLERSRSGFSRRPVDIRCVRSAIDDPESVSESIERVRTRSGAEVSATRTE